MDPPFVCERHLGLHAGGAVFISELHSEYSRIWLGISAVKLAYFGKQLQHVTHLEGFKVRVAPLWSWGHAFGASLKPLWQWLGITILVFLCFATDFSWVESTQVTKRSMLFLSYAPCHHKTLMMWCEKFRQFVWLGQWHWSNCHLSGECRFPRQKHRLATPWSFPRSPPNPCTKPCNEGVLEKDQWFVRSAG